MATGEPIIVICTEPKILRPMPKRINKRSANNQHNKKYQHNNRPSKLRMNRLNNVEHKKNMKNHLHEEKKKNFSLNLDLITLEEIENDFKLLKSKSEEIAVQKELVHLILKTENESFSEDYCGTIQKIKRPHNPFYKNFK